MAQPDRVQTYCTPLFGHHGRHKLSAERLLLLLAALIPRLRPLLISVGSGVHFDSEAAFGSGLHIQLVPDIKGADDHLFSIFPHRLIKLRLPQISLIPIQI